MQTDLCLSCFNGLKAGFLITWLTYLLNLKQVHKIVMFVDETLNTGKFIIVMIILFDFFFFFLFLNSQQDDSAKIINVCSIM